MVSYLLIYRIEIKKNILWKHWKGQRNEQKDVHLHRSFDSKSSRKIIYILNIYYLQDLQQLKTSMEKQTKIAKDVHNLYTLTQNKIGLSSFEDKWYISSNGITSLAYGYYEIKKDCRNEQENADLCQ